MSLKPIHPADAEVPSAVVLETAYNKVSKDMSLEDFFVVWRACGHSLSDTLLRGRGCKIANFALFGYNTQEVNLPSRLCQHVVESTLSTAADFIKQQCTVALSFQPLGIFTCNADNVAFRFSAEFKEKVRVIG